MSSDEAAGDAEDQEHVRFMLMPADQTFDGQERVMSRAAYKLQVHATAHSASCGHPGLVPDEYLDSLRMETTITPAELCIVGLWQRVDDGYCVLDWEAVEICLDQVRKIRREDPQARAWEQEREAQVQAQMAKAMVVTPPCVVCGTPVSPHRARGPGTTSRPVGAMAQHSAGQHLAATRARTVVSPVQRRRDRK